MDAAFIRIVPVKEDILTTKIDLTKLLTEKLINWNNKLIEDYLKRVAK